MNPSEPPRSASHARRRAPGATNDRKVSAEPPCASPPLYRRILYSASTPSPPKPPRILHSASHTALDPLILDLVALALRAYVTTWYNSGISRDPDKDFLQAVTAVLVHVIQALEVRLANVDLAELVLVDLSWVFERHYRDWDIAVDKFESGMAHNLSVDEIFHRLNPHLAVSIDERFSSLTDPSPESRTGRATVDKVYLRALVDPILKLLLPPEDYRAETERTIVREILVGVVFKSVFNRVAQPWFLFGVGARTLEAREAANEVERKMRDDAGGRDDDPPSFLDKVLNAFSQAPTWISSVVSTVTKVAATSDPSPSTSPAVTSCLVSLVESILPHSRALSHLLTYLSLLLSLVSSPIDALVRRSVESRLASEQTVKAVLEGAIRGMFPNDGWPAAKEPDPDEDAARELERRCKEVVARLIPEIVAKYLCPEPSHLAAGNDRSIDSHRSKADPRFELSNHLLRPFSSHTANVHLFVTVIDLVVGKVFPELIEPHDD
ncbi:hypothetical protein JCM10212_006299 [Sporobolomyces blumeae]